MDNGGVTGLGNSSITEEGGALRNIGPLGAHKLVRTPSS